ncbi:MAG: hypothetical protein ACJ8AI_32975 [Rhodopila sp.]
MTVLLRPHVLQPVGPLAAITRAAAARLAALEAKADADMLWLVDQAIALLDRTMPGRPYWDLPPALYDFAAAGPLFLPLLTARLLAGISARHLIRPVPDVVLPELRRQAMRILALDSPALDDDAFRQDLSICLLLSFPCVAQVVTETGVIPRRALTSGGLAQALRLGAWLAATGLRSGPYLELHTHAPMLDDFNPAGWERCHELAAELLKMRPNCPGIIGSSWFYDPALGGISPRLTYLATIPIRGGAFRVRLGASRQDAALATATSPTRRARVESGEYVPARWLLIWPRRALLAWAAQRPDEMP